MLRTKFRMFSNMCFSCSQESLNLGWTVLTPRVTWPMTELFVFFSEGSTEKRPVVSLEDESKPGVSVFNIFKQVKTQQPPSHSFTCSLHLPPVCSYIDNVPLVLAADLGDGSVGVLHLHCHHRHIPSCDRGRQVHSSKWRRLGWVSISSEADFAERWPPSSWLLFKQLSLISD